MAVEVTTTYKVLVIGDVNVGKTCLVHRFCDERYYDTYISTVGKQRINFFKDCPAISFNICSIFIGIANQLSSIVIVYNRMHEKIII